MQNSGSIVFRLCNPRSLQQTCVDYVSASSVLDGSWHWVVLSRSSAYVASVYVDCVLQIRPQSDAVVTGALDSGTSFILGHPFTDQQSFAVANFSFTDASGNVFFSFLFSNSTAFNNDEAVDSSGHGRNGALVGTGFGSLQAPSPFFCLGGSSFESGGGG